LGLSVGLSAGASLLGRTYLPGEEQEGKNDVAVLGFDTWKNYFGGDQNIVNRTVKLNDRIFTIIGVMPDGFRFPLSKRKAIYTPIHLDYPWMSFDDYRSAHWLP
jgi:putative ABC transport system permease protein